MYLQDILTALQVGQLHRHPPVEPSGTGQRRVKGLGPVGGGEDNDAGVAGKAVHLRQELVQRLLPLVVAAVLTAAALLADGVDLVDEHNAGCLLLGLIEQVAHLGCAHAHEHLHKLRAGDGEEGYVGFTGHGLGQHGLAGTRRAYQQDALGHGGADLLIFAGVVEVIDHLLQILLGLVLTGHVGKADAAVRGLDVDLGVGLAHAEHHGACAAAGLVRQLLGHELADADEQKDRQHPRQQDIQERGHLLHDLAGELRAGGVEPVHQLRVVQHAGLVDLAAVLVGEDDLVGLDLHLTDLLVLRHGHEGAVVYLLHLLPCQQRHGEEVEQQQHQQRHNIIIEQRFLRCLDLFHTSASLQTYFSEYYSRAVP